MKREEFLCAIDTLKLYRRAELIDDQGSKLIEDLYVDPLPDNHLLKILLKPNTTFLIGRKGTGKSTIFQRAQESLNQNKNTTWAYIDIKTLYESSVTGIIGELPKDVQNTLNPETLRKLLVFRNFIIELIEEIKGQISHRVNSSFKDRLLDKVTGTTLELFELLDEFIEELKADQYFNATGSIQASKSDEESSKERSSTKLDGSLRTGPLNSVKVSAMHDLADELEKKRSQNYSQVFIKVFNIKGLIDKLRDILKKLKLKHLYIFIDDFSELPKEEMELVVDSILAPLNNWSDEFIKLKIAVYPGRVYSGEIDLSKVDQVYLDLFKAYGQTDVNTMENKAIDFTQRLIEKRIQHFCNEDISEYFDIASNEIWRTLFFASIGNPRILGYILFFSYEISIIYGKKIGIKTIQDASKRYYIEKISPYFKYNKFLHESFDERSSIYSLKDLIEEIVKRAKVLRNYEGSKIFREMTGRPPTSHFHIQNEYDSVLSSLELNFFLTKYYEMRDKDGHEVSVYALNYGLCQQEAIEFGSPKGKREYRLYYIERIFDFTPIIISYIKVNQEIVCNNCGQRHSHEMLGAIQAFDMLCPACKKGDCKIVNLSKKYERLIKSVSDEVLLPDTELGILKVIHDERKEMFAKQIAAELDCSHQLIGKRGRNLAEKGLLSRSENEKGRRVFNITDIAEDVYFSDDEEDIFDFSIDEPESTDS